MKPDARCIVCGETARHTLGIRARYGKQRDALWAPDIDAYLCDTHAHNDCHLSLTLEIEKGVVEIETIGPRYTARTALRIGTRTKITPGQRSLL